MCVTAAVVRYVIHGRCRYGVATTYLQDRLNFGQSCPVFISHNPDFRLPADQSRPVVMIGPGTGLAPFRAFIQERSKYQSLLFLFLLSWDSRLTSTADSRYKLVSPEW